MRMLGERLKGAVEQSKFTADEVANALGMSKSNLYVLYKKPSFDVDYIRKASIFLNVPMSYFLEDNDFTSSKSLDGGAFGDQILKEIKEEMRLLREQLSVKDQQIAGLQRTVDALVGKSEGAIVEPLSSEMLSFDELMRHYKQTVMNRMRTPSIFLTTPLAKLVAPR